jgi:hypothetical protein
MSEPETLHPRPRTPGYFDGRPEAPRDGPRLNRKEPCALQRQARDDTANVQLYLPEASPTSRRSLPWMGAPLVGFGRGVKVGLTG